MSDNRHLQFFYIKLLFYKKCKCKLQDFLWYCNINIKTSGYKTPFMQHIHFNITCNFNLWKRSRFRFICNLYYFTFSTQSIQHCSKGIFSIGKSAGWKPPPHSKTFWSISVLIVLFFWRFTLTGHSITLWTQVFH